MPTILSVFYRSSHPSCAMVRFSADNDPGLVISILHESQMMSKPCADVYLFLGDESSEKIEVEDKDILVVLAKREERVVGCQVFEVALSTIHLGYLLVPRGGANILCSQEEQLRECDLERPTLTIHGALS